MFFGTKYEKNLGSSIYRRFGQRTIFAVLGIGPFHLGNESFFEIFRSPHETPRVGKREGRDFLLVIEK